MKGLTIGDTSMILVCFVLIAFILGAHQEKQTEQLQTIISKLDSTTHKLDSLQASTSAMQQVLDSIMLWP